MTINSQTNQQYAFYKGNPFYEGPIDLLNQDYVSKSSDNNQSQLINMYLEVDQSKGKYSTIAYSMPGLETFCNTGQANVRALYEQNEVLYAVAGNKFYSINSSGITTLLGTLNTSSGFAKIAAITGGNDNNNQLIIIDGTNGYHYNIGTNTATFPIADADFPQTCIDLISQDDYFIVLANNSISFYISNVADGLTWNALDFASKTGLPDRINAIATSQRKIYLLGTKTTEIYYNSGNQDFPFERVLDVFLHHGSAARRSVYSCEEYIIFLSKVASGGYQVVMLNGYDIKPLGDPASDYQIAQMATKSDAIGYCYKKDGHEFYDLTFPTDGKTITFDITTQISINRQSYIGATYTRFLGQCSSFCYDKSLIGDYNSGIIYNQSSSIYTENGNPLRRMLVSPPIYFNNKRLFISRLEIEVDFNVGSSKTFTVEKSLDAGQTWTLVNTHTISTNNITRLFTNNLGSGRSWMFRITTTMDAKFNILGFQAHGSLGSN